MIDKLIYCLLNVIRDHSSTDKEASKKKAVQCSCTDLTHRQILNKYVHVAEWSEVTKAAMGSNYATIGL